MVQKGKPSSSILWLIIKTHFFHFPWKMQSISVTFGDSKVNPVVTRLWNTPCKLSIHNLTYNLIVISLAGTLGNTFIWRRSEKHCYNTTEKSQGCPNNGSQPTASFHTLSKQQDSHQHGKELASLIATSYSKRCFFHFPGGWISPYPEEEGPKRGLWFCTTASSTLSTWSYLCTSLCCPTS